MVEMWLLKLKVCTEFEHDAGTLQSELSSKAKVPTGHRRPFNVYSTSIPYFNVI
jgi:hypothetical protein